jgi:peptidoglycan-associated lipoprotein
MMLFVGCHKKVVAPTAPPPPPPTPAPTAVINADPAVIEPGQSTTLTWKTSDASSATITDLGTVPSNGSHTVTPTTSTNYTLAVKGEGGTAEANVRVTVNPAPPPAVAATPSLTDEELFASNVRDIYFEYDAFKLRPEDTPTVEQDAAFLKSHPNMNVVIEGHCDDRGSEEYNIALGASRASSLKDALAAEGLSTGRIKTISYGKEKPFCTEENEQCWQQNRRAHVLLDR